MQQPSSPQLPPHPSVIDDNVLQFVKQISNSEKLTAIYTSSASSRPSRQAQPQSQPVLLQQQQQQSKSNHGDSSNNCSSNASQPLPRRLGVFIEVMKSNHGGSSNNGNSNLPQPLPQRLKALAEVMKSGQNQHDHSGCDSLSASKAKQRLRESSNFSCSNSTSKSDYSISASQRKLEKAAYINTSHRDVNICSSNSSNSSKSNNIHNNSSANSRGLQSSVLHNSRLLSSINFANTTPATPWDDLQHSINNFSLTVEQRDIAFITQSAAVIVPRIQLIITRCIDTALPVTIFSDNLFSLAQWLDECSTLLDVDNSSSSSLNNYILLSQQWQLLLRTFDAFLSAIIIALSQHGALTLQQLLMQPVSDSMTVIMRTHSLVSPPRSSSNKSPRFLSKYNSGSNFLSQQYDQLLPIFEPNVTSDGKSNNSSNNFSDRSKTNSKFSRGSCRNNTAALQTITTSLTSLLGAVLFHATASELPCDTNSDICVQLKKPGDQWPELNSSNNSKHEPYDMMSKMQQFARLHKVTVITPVMTKSAAAEAVQNRMPGPNTSRSQKNIAAAQSQSGHVPDVTTTVTSTATTTTTTVTTQTRPATCITMKSNSNRLLLALVPGNYSVRIQSRGRDMLTAIHEQQLTVLDGFTTTVQISVCSKMMLGKSHSKIKCAVIADSSITTISSNQYGGTLIRRDSISSCKGSVISTVNYSSSNNSIDWEHKRHYSTSNDNIQDNSRNINTRYPHTQAQRLLDEIVSTARQLQQQNRHSNSKGCLIM